MAEFKFELYCLDTETTGLSHTDNEIVELSIYRFSDQSQRTWCMQPKKLHTIQADALRINGHKLEDLSHMTAYGKATYLDPMKVIPQIENWFLEDGVTDADRVLVGQNPNFDCQFLQALWRQENCSDTFPFGKRPFTIDTREIALFIDLLEGTRSEYYNLGSLIKKFGIKNSKAHTAEADTVATKELFLAQLDYVKSKFKRSNV